MRLRPRTRVPRTLSQLPKPSGVRSQARLGKARRDETRSHRTCRAETCSQLVDNSPTRATCCARCIAAIRSFLFYTTHHEARPARSALPRLPRLRPWPATHQARLGPRDNPLDENCVTRSALPSTATASVRGLVARRPEQAAWLIVQGRHSLSHQGGRMQAARELCPDLL